MMNDELGAVEIIGQFSNILLLTDNHKDNTMPLSCRRHFEI